MLRLLICDDQDIVRQGLEIIFSNHHLISVVGLATNGKEAVQFALELQPDVVLMDLKMPKMNGIHATREIKSALPECKIIVLTTYDSDNWVFEAIQAGASGYLLKDMDRDALLNAVLESQTGRVYIDPQIAGKILILFQAKGEYHLGEKQDVDPIWTQLTDRELEVLELMVAGYTNQEIADELHLAIGTIKNNVSNIIGKLHMNDRTQVVLKALRDGMVKL